MNPGKKLHELLRLRWPPVAVAFLPAPPAGVPRVDAPGPAGCAYWRLAAEGKTFYTEATDHHGCVIGSHTHGIDLPPEKAEELQQMVSIMVGLQYLRMDEVASLPRRSSSFGVAVYAPLDKAPCTPDVVLVRGRPGQIMLLAEAAQAIGIAHDGAVMGRPACSMVSASIDSQRGATSLGCIGNRVYTDLGADELYYAVPGPKLAELVQKLETITGANETFEKFHRGRLPV